MVSNTSLSPRKAVLSVLFALLLISAGCNGLGVGESDTGPNDGAAEPTPATATSTPTTTPTSTPDPSAEDLREIELQVVGSDDYAPNTRGEIDRGDLTNENGHYEPVVFAAQANDTINISAYSSGGDPMVELRAPNGTTLAIDDDGGPDEAASIDNETVPVTGRYTVLVSPGEDSTTGTFSYRLTVDRRAYEGELEPDTPTPVEETPETEIPETEKPGWYAGDPANWNESEWYAEYAGDFAGRAHYSFAAVNAEPGLWVNAQKDYAVITMIDGPFYNGSQRQDIASGLAYANVETYDDYLNADDADPTNASWAPDRIYVRFVTPEDRGLYRINAFTKAAAAEGANDTGQERYGPSVDDFFFSIQNGPANDLETDVGDRADLDYIDKSGEKKVPLARYRVAVNKTTSPPMNGTTPDS